MASQSRWVGRIALVTGGSMGIGEATARLLIKEGMKVVICGRNVEHLQSLDAELNKDRPSRCLLTVKCDVSKEDQVLEMFKQIRSEFGKLDVCVNNAGLNQKNTSLLEGDTEAWKTISDVNVIGLCICTREAVKLMREKGVDDGHVIHVSSLSGHRVPPVKHSHFYAASKFAVKALTEGLRQELREIESGIRVSSISPGFVKTDFARGVVEDFDTFRKSMVGLASEDVAELIWACIKQPPSVQVHDILVRATHSSF